MDHESWMLGTREVRRIGFGAMRLTGHAAFGVGPLRNRDESIAVVRAAVELGVDHIDTADFYFSSAFSANEVIRSALGASSDHVLVATKVGPRRDASGEWMPWARPEELRAQVEANLRELDRDFLELVYLRAYGAGSIAPHIEALDDLKQQGLVQNIGVSTVSVDQLEEARTVAPIVAVQNRYSIDDRSPQADQVLSVCRALGIAFVPYFAIAGAGREAGIQKRTDEFVERVAARHGVQPAQVRLAWTLSRGDNVLAIPGTGDLEHLRQNLAANQLRLTPTDLEELERSIT